MTKTQRIKESEVESYLTDQAKALGIGCHKYINMPGRGGTPGFVDQVLAIPSGHTVYVEAKAPDKIAAYMKKRARFFETGDTTGCGKTDVRQYREQQKLMDRQQMVAVVGTFEQVDELIKTITILYL